MTKLSDTQRVILSKAAQHEAILAEPPAKLPAAARNAVLRSMIGQGLLEEVPALREAIGMGWRQDEDGAWIALRITAAGLAAIGVEPEAAAGTDVHDEQEDDPPRDERNGVDPSARRGAGRGAARSHHPARPHPVASAGDGVSIRAADMPGADDLMLRIYAAMAQKERELISERTKAALAAAKARGKVLGGDRGYRPTALARTSWQQPWRGARLRSGRRIGCNSNWCG